MMVSGGMMLGFDSDTKDIFEQQYEFGMTLPVPMFMITPLSAPMTTPLYSRLLAENRLVEHRKESAPVLPWSTNIIPKQMTYDELVLGVRWLCNRLYRPAAFEHRVAHFIELFQPPVPRPNSRSQHSGSQREIDVQRVELARHVNRLGPAEAAMAERLQRRLMRRPDALPMVLLAMGYYMQVRHMYQRSGRAGRTTTATIRASRTHSSERTSTRAGFLDPVSCYFPCVH
jgi:hypothetical protein